ncbi:MAG: alkaline phosphatase family protein, partial [bacterium]|nr:alkaline phosphatase family protein [bacterium]
GFPLIPGFRFLMKKENVVFAPQYAETLNLLEKSEYLKDKKGLLRDGLGVMTLFSGGSGKSISMNSITKNKKLLLKPFFFFINPFTLIWRLLRIFVLYLIEKSEQQKNKDASLLPRSSSYVWYRVLHEIFFGELAYETVKKAIPTEDKVIFVNFTGYDEVSHHHGGYSKPAFFYLSIIDMYVKKLFKEAEKYNNEREIFLISDHGQTTCIPETAIIKSTIGEAIASLYPDKRIIQHKLDYKSSMLLKSDLYVMNSGAVCLIYNNKKEEKLNRKELEANYPDFCVKTSNFSTIVDFVLVRNEKIIAVKNGISYDLEMKNAQVLFPFMELKYQEKAIEWLTIVINGPYAPDALILGKMLEKNKMVNFESQLSTHGAIGGYQTQSFLLSKTKLQFEKELPELRDFHDYLEEQIFGN